MSAAATVLSDPNLVWVILQSLVSESGAALWSLPLLSALASVNRTFRAAAADQPVLLDFRKSRLGRAQARRMQDTQLCIAALLLHPADERATDVLTSKPFRCASSRRAVHGLDRHACMRLAGGRDQPVTLTWLQGQAGRPPGAGAEPGAEPLAVPPLLPGRAPAARAGPPGAQPRRGGLRAPPHRLRAVGAPPQPAGAHACALSSIAWARHCPVSMQGEGMHDTCNHLPTKGSRAACSCACRFWARSSPRGDLHVLLLILAI